jgi:hypothetical protein
MRSPIRASLLAAALVAALATGSLQGHAATSSASITPRRIALQPGDMPAGYVRYLARVTTNSTIARENGVPVNVYNGLGRVVGFETGYKGSSSHPMCCVDVQVVQYRSAAGAEQAFELGQQMVKNTYGHDRGFRAMDDGIGMTGVQMFPCHCGNAGKQTVYIITTHLRNFLVSTEVHFTPGTAQKTISATAARFQTLMVNRVP